MNKINQYIFGLYYYVVNLGDTFQFCLPREHQKNVYEQRKKVLLEDVKPGTYLGNFLEKNPDFKEKFEPKLTEFINDIYGESSTFLVAGEGENIRVDHTQHVRLYDELVPLLETMRNVVFSHIMASRQNNEFEQKTLDMFLAGDRLHRVVLVMLAMQDYVKSYVEFEKAMKESNGKPTPQSNFIAKEELAKISNAIRFSRQHCYFHDNDTLDLLDDVNEVLENCEGRRELRPGKNLDQTLKDLQKRVQEMVAKLEPIWAKQFQELLKQFLELNKAAQEAIKQKAGLEA